MPKKLRKLYMGVNKQMAKKKLYKLNVIEIYYKVQLPKILP